MTTPAKDKDFSKLYHKVIDSGIWAQLSPKAKALYIVHLRHADYTTRNGSPDVPTLVKKSGLNKGSVFRGNQELCKAGLMKMWKHDRRRRQNNNPGRQCAERGALPGIIGGRP